MSSPVSAGMWHFLGLNMQKKYNICNEKIQCDLCESNDICKAWIHFVNNHKDVKSYAHFDLKVSLRHQSVREYVMSEIKVKQHSFYPFIHFEKSKNKFNSNIKPVSKKYRDIYYCSHLDRCVYQRYAFLINYRYNIYMKDKSLSNVAIAYRDELNKSNINFAKEVFDNIKLHDKCFIMVGDFKSFFDNIDHNYLKKMLCTVMETERLPDDYFTIFKNITRYAFFEWDDIVEISGEKNDEPGLRNRLNSRKRIITHKEFHDNKRCIKKHRDVVGIPQGSPISAVLSNVYIIEFDEYINNCVSSRNGIYRRYSDDFFICVPYTSDDEIEKFKSDIQDYIESMKQFVILEESKTKYYTYEANQIINYESGKPDSLNYLGFIFDGTDVKIRPKSITKYYYRMRRKARTIGRCNWKTRTGKHITAKKLYSIYSDDNRSGEKQTFIGYVKKSKKIMGLNDKESSALLKRHKHKIANTIRKAEQEMLENKLREAESDWG